MKPQTAPPRRAHQPDYVLALVIFILLAMGLVMIYSISPILSFKVSATLNRNYYFYNHLLNLTIGVVAWIVVTAIDYRVWKRLAAPLLAISVLCLAALMVPALASTKNGATRWLALGPFSFQPSELLKLALILYLAVWFEKRQDRLRSFWETFVPFIGIMFITSVAVAVFQKNLSTTAVMALAALAMYFVAGISWKQFGLLVGGALAFAWILIITFPHRVARLATFLNPTKVTAAAGYQISQALIAVGSGGIFGVGLGKSIQVHGYLPEVANDSIYAIIGEEFGLIGSLIMLGLFTILIVRGFKIARNAPDLFSRLVATGISVWLFFQALVNIAAMLSLVPLTGIPLPFVSYGGSSLIISLVGAGILLNISKYTLNEASDATDSLRRRHRRPYNAGLGHRSNPQIAR